MMVGEFEKQFAKKIRQKIKLRKKLQTDKYFDDDDVIEPSYDVSGTNFLKKFIDNYLQAKNCRSRAFGF